MKRSKPASAVPVRKEAPPIPETGAAGQKTVSVPETPAAPSSAPAPSSPDEEARGQRFIKNSQYFTICIYGAIMAIITVTIIKAIIDFQSTREIIRQVLAVLSPFVFGALLAYVLNPMVRMFYRLFGKIIQKTRIPMKHSAHMILSILITYIIVLGFISVTITYVVPELINNAMDFANYIPHAYDTLLEQLAFLEERFPDLNWDVVMKPLNDTIPDLIRAIRSMITNMVPTIYTVSMSIASWIINVLITIIVSVYMLYDKRRLMRSCWRIIYAFMPEKHIPVAHEILTECNRLFSSFVVGKFIDSTIIGVLCFFLMMMFGMDYAPLISLIVGVTNMLPYFGPFIGAVPGILILLFVKPVDSLIFAIMILCLQQFDGLILGPKILGNSTGIKPLWIIFSIIVGGSIAGVIGMFLGVPVVAVLSYLIDRYLQYRLKRRHISEERIEEALASRGSDDYD